MSQRKEMRRWNPLMLVELGGKKVIRCVPNSKRGWTFLTVDLEEADEVAVYASADTPNQYKLVDFPALLKHQGAVGVVARLNKILGYEEL